MLAPRRAASVGCAGVAILSALLRFDKIAGRLGERFPGLGQDFLYINGAQLAHRICYSILQVTPIEARAMIAAPASCLNAAGAPGV